MDDRRLPASLLGKRRSLLVADKDDEESAVGQMEMTQFENEPVPKRVRSEDSDSDAEEDQDSGTDKPEASSDADDKTSETSGGPVGYTADDYADEGKSDGEGEEDWQAALEQAKPKTVDVKKYGSAAERMMAKMGYDPTAGLGAAGQGRMDPVEVSMQRGRTGLGLKTPKELQMDFSLTWDETKEETSVEEHAVWLPSAGHAIPKFSDLTKWKKEGEKLTAMEGQTEFVEPEVLRAMLAAKNVFDELSDRDMHNARQRANPYETVKGAIFQNRAAVKMANMDAVFDDLFTNPPLPFQPDGEEERRWCPPDLKTQDMFYFADICAGPGGFSEYVLWRRGFHGHGFGFTLKDSNDFKLDKFQSACPEFFETYYGSAGDGDITKPQNLQDFKNVVMAGTGDGVHLVMADGGFSVAGQENIQEMLSKRIYLCQLLCALNVLKPGGNFVCKLFDVFTPFSVGLLYLMYLVFDRLCIHKPHTSRPANSERYLVGRCMRPRQSIQSVVNYLDQVNRRLDNLSKSKNPEERDCDVVEVVPMDVIKADEMFFAYITGSNNMLARRQTVYLDKYRVFAKNTNLQSPNQAELRAKCLSYWRVPDQQRPQHVNNGPARAFVELTGLPNADSLICATAKKYPAHIVDELTAPEANCNVVGLDYRAGVVTTPDGPQLWMGLGRVHTYVLSSTGVGGGGGPSGMPVWSQQHHVRLPRGTLLYAELAQLWRGQKQAKLAVWVLRVFDAHMIAGTPVHQMAYAQRQLAIGKLCRALRRDHNPTVVQGYVQLLPAQCVRLCNLKQLVEQRMSLASDRGALCIQLAAESADERDALRKRLGPNNPNVPQKPQFYVCRALALFSPLKRGSGWITRWSRSSKQSYMFECKPSGSKHFETERVDGDQFETSAHADFGATVQSQINWLWRSVEPPHVKRLFEHTPTEEESSNAAECISTIPGLLGRVEQQLSACHCDTPPDNDLPLTRP